MKDKNVSFLFKRGCKHMNLHPSTFQSQLGYTYIWLIPATQDDLNYQWSNDLYSYLQGDPLASLRI